MTTTEEPKTNRLNGMKTMKQMTTGRDADRTVTEEPIDLLSLGEVAGLLRVHENTARRLLQKRAFTGAFKIERDWRIPRRSVVAWISARVTDHAPST